ncbi:aminotransferase class III-fold pyridoxal phosphate-dependent enzyme [Rhizobium sp. CG5]|uniref:aminotransferase family protein n=1 Tax=Rhizobium sp. CG5 TaxID=2726076 RepID=UPI002033A278|nr:aminotransferase class III-fold pyridoxal phosphate-dependent enzyme [Rhizobium sp. CG5]MCM2477380.1 aminotransferase class III-fold pyridoxal phosphate-dependent enzyme [Rhizobium sp. CG5]
MSNTADALKHVWFHATGSQTLRSDGGMTVFTKGEDCYLIDENGNRFLDGLSGGAFVTNIGHGRAEIAEAMAAQARELAYVSPYNFVAPPTVKLAKVVADLAPGDLERVFFTSGGSEAVETAMKIAKQYHWLGGDQKRTKVISRRGSYHGSTQYTMSISGASHDFNNKIFGPLVPGCIQVPHNNCYRCEYGLSRPTCKTLCASMIEKAILHEGPETVAAIIAEPVPAAASIYPAPDEYLPMLREIADKYGVLLIIDEVINGFGRTGSMFACEQWGVVPDIMTMAKGLTSGYVPMGAAIASKRVVSRFEEASGREAGLNHVLSFGGHAVAAAAALKNIEILQNENLVENSREMGKYLLDGLDSLRKLPIVGDVRGRGLLVGVELVRDKQTREAFRPQDQMSVRMTNYLREEGILARTYQVVEFGPPLTAGRKEVEMIVSGMERAVLRFAADMQIS